MAEALQAYRTGKFDAAIEKYNQILADDAKSADAYAGLIRLYLKREEVDKAQEIAVRGMAAAPDSNVMQTALAELEFRQGKIPEAEQIFVKVINTGDLNARAYWGLARIRDAISMHKKAKDLLDRAHAFDPADPDIQRYWMSSLKRSERLKYLENYLTSQTDDDSSEREWMNRYVALLKDREQNPQRTCHLVNKVESTITPLVRMLRDPTHMSGYGLMVKFNSQNARLLLDTGASGLVVKKSVAEKAGIKSVVQSKIGGIGDKADTEAYLGYADSIRIGELEFQNCLVEVTQKSFSADEDGLIGADVFSSYLVDLDFNDEKLKLSPLPPRPNETSTSATLNTQGTSDEDNDEAAASDAQKPAPRGPQDRYIAPEMQSYTRVYRFGHNLLIPTSIGEAKDKLFIIDSGSNVNFISPRAAREVTHVHSESNVRIHGLSGSVDRVFTADKAVLQFGHYRQENQEIAAFDFSKISKHVGTEVSGFLGFVTLRMFDVKIDYRDGLVNFDFNRSVYGK